MDQSKTAISAPLVSIGLPVYNGEDYLRETIQSLLNQDYDNIELIIFDNASTDSTGAICREFANEDQRVKYFRNAYNLGAAANYNLCFEESHGEYFKWAAHDDVCHHSMVSNCVKLLEASSPDVSLAYPLGQLIGEDGQVIRSPLDKIALDSDKPHRRLSYLLKKLNMCDPIFGLYRRRALEGTQLIGAFCGADYVLLGELLLVGRFVEHDETLFSLRQHRGRSMTANTNVRSRTAWYGPAAEKRVILLPVWEQMIWELQKSIWRSDIGVWNKISCTLSSISTHYWRRLRIIMGKYRRKLLNLNTAVTAQGS